MIKGFDCSHFNNINWATISPDFKFVWCKAAQGSTYHDPLFSYRWGVLAKMPIKKGLYLFVDIRHTAQEHIDNLKSLNIDFKAPNVMPLMIDVEDQVDANPAIAAQLNHQVMSNKAAYIQLVNDIIRLSQEQLGTRNPVIYSYNTYLNELGYRFPNQPLWLASYPTENNPQELQQPHGTWSFWQYTQDGDQHGNLHGGDLDLDYFNGTDEQLSLL